MAKMTEVFTLAIGGPLCSVKCARVVIRILAKYGACGPAKCYSIAKHPECGHYVIRWHARRTFKAWWGKDRRVTSQAMRRCQVGLGAFADGYLTARNEK